MREEDQRGVREKRRKGQLVEVKGCEVWRAVTRKKQENGGKNREM